MEKLASGNLDLSVEILSNDEVGKLGQTMNSMIGKLRDVVADVQSASNGVFKGSQQLSSGAAQLSGGSTEQAAAAEEASSSIEEMNATIKQNAGNAGQTGKIALKSSMDARESGGAVTDAMTAIEPRGAAECRSCRGDVHHVGGAFGPVRAASKRYWIFQTERIRRRQRQCCFEAGARWRSRTTCKGAKRLVSSFSCYTLAMILLITDGRPCTLRSALSQADRKSAFLELKSPEFSHAFSAVLEDRGLAITVIECFMNMRRCLELLRDVKKRRPDVPVIFVISSGSEHIVTETLRCGARYCFKKPFAMVRFKERIRTLLELKHASQERRAPLLSEDPNPAKGAGLTNDMPENLLRTINFIEDNAGERGLSVERLADIACMSPFHFCRVFKKHTNKSPMQFVNHVRIEKAKELLASSSGSMSISLIANTAGFCDSSNFNKHFKKATGLTPSAFKLQGKTFPPQ